MKRAFLTGYSLDNNASIFVDEYAQTILLQKTLPRSKGRAIYHADKIIVKAPAENTFSVQGSECGV
jgi:hypothetical protein